MALLGLYRAPMGVEADLRHLPLIEKRRLAKLRPSGAPCRSLSICQCFHPLDPCGDDLSAARTLAAMMLIGFLPPRRTAP